MPDRLSRERRILPEELTVSVLHKADDAYRFRFSSSLRMVGYLLEQARNQVAAHRGIDLDNAKVSALIQTLTERSHRTTRFAIKSRSWST